MSHFTRGLLALFVTLGVAPLYAPAQSASALPIDPSATFKTIIPHRNALPRPKTIVEVPEEGEALAPGFSGSPYGVGATITPTTTVPEGEEHIAVDPKNFNNVIAMISDFSQNGGFNISKFAFSSTNGASWSESFVPLSGGFPATADNHVWQANSDPVVAIDKLGNAYLANLYLQVNSSGNVTNDGYYVCSAKLTSGPTFKQSGCHPVLTTLKSSTNLEDKEWLAVDNHLQVHGRCLRLMDAFHQHVQHDLFLPLDQSRRDLVQGHPDQSGVAERSRPGIAGGGRCGGQRIPRV